jgi:hypothetical protein
MANIPLVKKPLEITIRIIDRRSDQQERTAPDSMRIVDGCVCQEGRGMAGISFGLHVG